MKLVMVECSEENSSVSISWEDGDAENFAVVEIQSEDGEAEAWLTRDEFEYLVKRIVKETDAENLG